MSRHITRYACFVFAILSFLLASQGPSVARPLDKLGWLVGGVWTADASRLPGGLARIETRYDSAANGALIRFTTEFLDSKNNVENRYAGNLFFDPDASSLRMWYIDGQNAITQGQVTVNGNEWALSFRGPGDIVGEKQPINFRCNVVLESPDAYTWSLSAQIDKTWKPIFNLEYKRASALAERLP